MKSPGSLAFLLDNAGETLSEPSRDIAASRDLASTLNVMLSFKPRVVPTRPQRELIRGFLEGLALATDSPDIRAIAYCALRQSGDDGSIQLIDSLPELTGAWSSVAAETKRTIRKRLRSEAGQDTQGTQ